MRSLKIILTDPRCFGPAWVFASLNILIGTWAIYIPTVTDKLGISEGELGLSLFFFAMGTMVSIPLAPVVIERAGLGRSTVVGVVLFCFSFILPFVAANHFSLSAALFLVGGTSGFTDIAMNTLVSEIEGAKKVQIMSAAHGFFSLGGVLGAGIGSLMIPWFSSPFRHVMVVAALVLLINLLLSRFYIRVTAMPKPAEATGFKILKPLIALGLISFIVMASEGAMVDWSGLYLEKVTLARSALLVGMGYTVFSACMTLGRFFGDYVSHRFGSYTIIIYGLLIGVAGYLVILTGFTIAAIVGFGMLGLGFSVIIPELFRLGGNVPGIASAKGISFIAGSGYVGFLLGPVVLGFLAQWWSLRISFVALLAGAFVAMITVVYRKSKGS